MAYGKVLQKIKSNGHTCYLQVNGRFYEMTTSVPGAFQKRHRLFIPCTNAARLQAHWEGFWETFMIQTLTGKNNVH